MLVMYHAYVSKISNLSSFWKINGKVLWKKKILFAQFQNCLNVFERRVVNYEFWLKSDRTVKEILATMSKRA